MREGNFQPRRKVLKKKLRWGRFFVLFILLGGISLAGYGVFSLLDFLYFTKLDTSKVTTPQNARLDPQMLETRINVLLLGLDGRKEDGTDKPQRTDSILFVSFNTKDKKVTALSLPRDTLVKIPLKKGQEKINHAYSYGKEALSRQVVADFLRVPVHYHAVMDAECFMNIIDILGGIGLYVENDLDYEDPYQNLYIHIKKGYQKLNGEQAIKYIRFRSDELGDVGRVLRQQKFLKAFCEQFFSFQNIVKLPYLKPVFEKMLQTDVTLLGFIKMAFSFKQYSKDGIDFEMLPGEFETIDDISYWVCKPEQMRATLDKWDIEYVK